MKKIVIKNHDSMLSLLAEHSLKMGATIQKLIISLLDEAHSEGEDSVLIKVHSDLVAMSYRLTPASFAHSFTSKVQYPVIQSYYKGSFICVRAGDAKRPTTFKARVREALIHKKKFVIAKAGIPVSYRTRPALLSAVLTADLGVQVCNSCKKDKVIWRTKKTV